MPQLKIRKPMVAGQFYPAGRRELIEQIASCVDAQAKKQNAIACVLPHAGYIYSGHVAGQALSRIALKEKIILLGPNHTGLGQPFSLMAEGIWQTPLGEVKIDSGLANRLLKGSSELKEDSLAHLDEHSLEVELPFLQYLKSDFSIVPIAFLSNDVAALKKIGREIAAVIREEKLENSVFVVASSDMTHYEAQAQAQRKDREAIQAILELDEDKLVEKIQGLNISMCGWAPVVVMLSLSKALGAKKAELAEYQTSGDVTGDTESVVGYAGVVVY